MSFLLLFEKVALRRGGKLLFEGLDINLGRGEALHVTGPNGSGKSSLLRLAAGLLQCEAGGTLCVTKAALADEALALDRELPLGRALAFWGETRLDAAIAAFSLDHLTGVPVRLLSAGQAKRASLARVMASGADVWLLDEPLNGLDREGAEQLTSAIAAHRAGGGAVVAASHQPLPGDWPVLELGN